MTAPIPENEPDPIKELTRKIDEIDRFIAPSANILFHSNQATIIARNDILQTLVAEREKLVNKNKRPIHDYS